MTLKKGTARAGGILDKSSTDAVVGQEEWNLASSTSVECFSFIVGEGDKVPNLCTVDPLRLSRRYAQYKTLCCLSVCTAPEGFVRDRLRSGIWLRGEFSRFGLYRRRTWAQWTHFAAEQKVCASLSAACQYTWHYDCLFDICVVLVGVKRFGFCQRCTVSLEGFNLATPRAQSLSLHRRCVPSVRIVDQFRLSRRYVQDLALLVNTYGPAIAWSQNSG